MADQRDTFLCFPLTQLLPLKLLAMCVALCRIIATRPYLFFEFLKGKGRDIVRNFCAGVFRKGEVYGTESGLRR